MQLPQLFLDSLEGIPGFDHDSFVEAHNSGDKITSVRINPSKISSVSFWVIGAHLKISSLVPWSEYGFYLDKRPSFTFDPLFHAGCYYVQEASSMFLEEAMRQTVDLTQPLRVLDLCAAPGGKSTHIQSLISPESLLVSNEVIKNRTNTLKQNIIKWGCNNVIITNNDPQHFKRLEAFFDVIVVDAPCSGSGLFRRDESAIDHWSPENVQLCSNRQQRILADIIPSLKNGGVLIYATCSFSWEEDEEVTAFLVDDLGLENIELALNPSCGIVETKSSKSNAHSYRFFPDKVKGEGFFLSLFKKSNGTRETKIRSSSPQQAIRPEKEIIAPWVKTDELIFLKHNETIYAWPEAMLDELAFIQSHLYIQYAGTHIGILAGKKLIPDHALALSSLVSDHVIIEDLILEDAIRYLQRLDLNVERKKKGWQLVSFRGHPLGWINALPNRINNYYPKELRILKQHNG